MQARKVTAFLVRDLLWDLSYPLNFLWRGSGIFFSLITFYFLGYLVSGSTVGYLSGYGGAIIFLLSCWDWPWSAFRVWL